MPATLQDCVLLYPVWRSNIKLIDYMKPEDYRQVFTVILEMSLLLFVYRKS